MSDKQEFLRFLKDLGVLNEYINEYQNGAGQTYGTIPSGRRPIPPNEFFENCLKGDFIEYSVEVNSRANLLWYTINLLWIYFVDHTRLSVTSKKKEIESLRMKIKQYYEIQRKQG